MILLLLCWIQFTGILMRSFSSMFFGEICHGISLSVALFSTWIFLHYPACFLCYSLHLIFLPLSPSLLYFLLSHSHFIYVYHVPSTIVSFETNGKMLNMISSLGNTQSILGSQSFRQVLSILKGCYGYM